jgi:hypothetical protein
LAQADDAHLSIEALIAVLERIIEALRETLT